MGPHCDDEMEADPASMRRRYARLTPRTRAGKIALRSLDDLDGRTSSARRAKELIANIASDLGGAEQLSAAAQQLAQRAAILGAMLEDLETRWATGEQIPLEEFLAATNTQRRVLVTLGLDRRTQVVDGTARVVQAIRAGAI